MCAPVIPSDLCYLCNERVVERLSGALLLWCGLQTNIVKPQRDPPIAEMLQR